MILNIAFQQIIRTFHSNQRVGDNSKITCPPGSDEFELDEVEAADLVFLKIVSPTFGIEFEDPTLHIDRLECIDQKLLLFSI